MDMETKISTWCIRDACIRGGVRTDVSDAAIRAFGKGSLRSPGTCA